MKTTSNTLEINTIEAQRRVLKMLDRHCKEIVEDLLNDINQCSEKDCEESLREIENTIEIIKEIHKFKKHVRTNITEKKSLNEILNLCDNSLIKEREEDFLCAYMGCGTKMCEYGKTNQMVVQNT